ncbi:hypothetical protein [Rhizosphaericola mali]|uniref:DUF4198 domain-containing protein n=1 Tax=Rhizosphaericola mali TaxID=2545455 RepID=A0A5P2G9F4_9BACT|nr:hypothetical protein [Rhizosphaericola mali]QES88151.1 hypothetical protein E0W69_005550 [Rhizosphaericola mali]
MRNFSILFLFLLFLFCPITIFAHGYWMEVTGRGKINSPVKIEICYGEIDDHNNRLREAGDDLKYIGKFQLFILDQNGKKTKLTLMPLKNSWYATFIPKLTGSYPIIAENDSLPVVDRSSTGGKNVRPVEYLYSQYNVGTNKDGKLTSQFLNILISHKKDMIEVRPMQDGKAVTNTKLRVFNPENWEKTLDINKDGKALFYPNQKGMYIIRMDWYDNQPGNWKGLSYTSTRHRCNYCLTIK